MNIVFGKNWVWGAISTSTPYFKGIPHLFLQWRKTVFYMVTIIFACATNAITARSYFADLNTVLEEKRFGGNLPLVIHAESLKGVMNAIEVKQPDDCPDR